MDEPPARTLSMAFRASMHLRHISAACIALQRGEAPRSSERLHLDCARTTTLEGASDAAAVNVETLQDLDLSVRQSLQDLSCPANTPRPYEQPNPDIELEAPAEDLVEPEPELALEYSAIEIDYTGLLELDWEAFVTQCYSQLLGKEIDDGGRGHYMAELFRGVEKRHIIERILREPEALERNIVFV